MEINQWTHSQNHKTLKIEEEDDKEEEMANLNLELMIQGPLALPVVIPKMQK